MDDPVARALAALHALRDQLEAQLGSDDVQGDVVDRDAPIGRLSRMDAMQQQQMDLARQRRLEARLSLVRAAFQRVALGSFGTCADCGEDMEAGRLEARPEVPFCRTCHAERGG